MARLVQILDQDSQELLLQFDAVRQYTIDGDVEVTEHPVEQGANITDHIRPKPRTLTLEGFVTDTPIPVSQGASFLKGQPMSGAAAYAILENRRVGGFLHTLVLPLDTLQNMALTRVGEPQDARTGGLRCTLTFKNIVTVTNQTILVQTATPVQQGTSALGKRQPKQVTPTSSNKSILKAGSDGLGITTPGSGVSGFPNGVPR